MKLTKLTKKQADDIGVPVEGPYKPGIIGIEKPGGHCFVSAVKWAATKRCPPKTKGEREIPLAFSSSGRDAAGEISGDNEKSFIPDNL